MVHHSYYAASCVFETAQQALKVIQEFSANDSEIDDLSEGEDYCPPLDEQRQEDHVSDSDVSNEDAGDDTECDDCDDIISDTTTNVKNNNRERFSGQWRATDVFNPEPREFIEDEDDSDS